MTAGGDDADTLDVLGLTEYEATALEGLLTQGRTTAPTLAESTGIPKARIYGVLDELADAGYIKIIPGRPKHYQPKPPGETLDRAIGNSRQEHESFRQAIEAIRAEFLETFEPLYEQATDEIRPAEELFWVVDVGEQSERETRELYRSAETAVYTMSKSLAFFDAIEPAVADALDRGIDVSVLLLEPDRIEPDNVDRQRAIVQAMRENYPGIDLRYSQDQLPWRGTFIDPAVDYSSGKAILLVEEEDVPNYLRQAAVTENGSFVAGLKRYFDLVWAYESETI